MWLFLLDGKKYITMLRKSYRPESQWYWVHGFLVITLKGPKSLIRTPAWLSDIWLCVALMKYYDWRLKTLYYLFHSILCFLYVTYLLLSYCLFILKVKQCVSDHRERTLYRFLIFWIRARLIQAIKLLLCEIELYLSMGDVFVLKEDVCYAESTIHLSWFFHLVIVR